MDEIEFKNPSMGWMPDYPDFRDYTNDHEDIVPMLNKIGAFSASKVPSKVDLRKWCSPIEDQGRIGSCTANAGVGLVEYLERRAHKRHINASRLFLYKITRNLLKWKGDTGAFLRSTMGALVMFGVPPEKYWVYDVKKYDIEPPSFCYSLAQNFKGAKYIRLDPPGKNRKNLLNDIKRYTSAGFPLIFGFAVYDSISQSGPKGFIPFPHKRERQQGGHAIMAVGYHNGVKIKNANGGITKGAIRIRNSWGTKWGRGGYGWLPYEYVLRGLAVDWWTMLKHDWIDTNQFGL